MTPNYDNYPPKKAGMPVWGWILIGCGVLPIPFIAILAAILFPVFAQAREKARQVSCLSNLKQQSLAVMMYSQDYDETLPPKELPWMDLTASYIKNDKVFQCPSAKTAGETDTFYGYTMNTAPMGKKLKTVAHPENIPLIFDSLIAPSMRNTAGTASNRDFAYRHRGNANVAYLDGHVKSLSNRR